MRYKDFLFHLKVFLLLIGTANVAGFSHLDCFTDDVADPIFNAVTSQSGNETMTSTSCCESCQTLMFETCGLSELAYCSCTNDVVSSLATGCGGTCSTDGEKCGLLSDPVKFDAYETGISAAGSSFDFTLELTQPSPPEFEVTITANNERVDFLIDFGDGRVSKDVASGSLADVGGGDYEYQFQFFPPILSKSYNMTVAGYTSRESVTKTEVYSVEPRTPSIDEVTCPQVFEPDVEYACNVSLHYAYSDHDFMVTFDDDNVDNAVSKIGPVLTTISNEISFVNIFNVTSSQSSDVIRLYNHPIKTQSKIISVDIMTDSGGVVKVEILEPTCGASDVYCMSIQKCMAECPYDTENSAYKCLEQFCSAGSTCAAAGSCASGGNDPTWVNIDDVELDISSQHHEFATPIDVKPGSILQVTGEVFRREVENDVFGDTVNDVRTKFEHFISFVLEESAVPIAIPHSCSAILNDVTFSVADNSASAVTYAGDPATTKCERIIKDMSVLKIVQSETDSFDSTLNMADPFYVWAGTYNFDIMFEFSVGGPVNVDLEWTPADWAETTEVFDTDFPLGATNHTIQITRNIENSGVFQLVSKAHNNHNVFADTFTGVILPPVFSDAVTVHVLYPVSQTWEVVLFGETSALTFLIPTESPTFQFVETSGWQFPTNASVSVDWGDSTTEQFLFSDAEQLFSHAYSEDGLVTVNASVSNKVSGVVDVNLDVEIYRVIEGFAVELKYLVMESNELRGGSGPDENVFPSDKNVTFLTTVTEGTIETYVVKYADNDTEIYRSDTADKFSPEPLDFAHFFGGFEGFLNLTVMAINKMQTETIVLTIELSGEIIGLNVDDYSVTTKPSETKTFEISFESVGASSCVVVVFGDSSTPVSFGDETLCATNFSQTVFDPSIQTNNFINVTHTYSEPGVYEVAVIAYNEKSYVSDSLKISVTGFNCTTPAIEILNAVINYKSAPKLSKSEDHIFVASGSIDCVYTSETTKLWKIFAVDEKGTLKYDVNLDDVTIDKPVIKIPALSLPSGLYKAIYTISMNTEDMLELQGLTFTKEVDTFFEIVPTPIKVQFTDSVASRITKGFDQQILFEPLLYSVDPDFPDNKNFSIEWRCRTLTETYSDLVATVAMTPIVAAGTGCFGHGPGIINEGQEVLELQGKSFKDDTEIYFVDVILSKGNRTSSSSVEISVIDGNPPEQQINCVPESSCVQSATDSAMTINPNYRFSMKSECTDFCSSGSASDVSTSWTLKDENNNVVTVPDEYLPSGASSGEFSLDPKFFEDFSDVKNFALEVTSSRVDAPAEIGTEIYKFSVNSAPVSGSCSLSPLSGFTLIDVFEFECSGWVDPDGDDLESYSLFLNADGTSNILVEIYPIESMRTYDLVLPVGNFTLEVRIFDSKGAFAAFYIENVEAKMITEEQFTAFNVDKKVDELAGGGNLLAMQMTMTASSSVLVNAEWLDLNDPNLSDEELEARMLEVNEKNAKTIEGLLNNANYVSLSSADVSLGMIANIFDAASRTPNDALTIDLLTRGNVFTILEDLMDKVEKLPASSVDELKGLVEKFAIVSAGIAVGLEEVTKDDASRVPPKDFENSEDMYYDTDIGYDINMTIPSELDMAKKFNVKDTTVVGSRWQIPKLEILFQKLSGMILERQLTNDAMSVSTPNNMTVFHGKFSQLGGTIVIGNSAVTFPEGFSPDGEGPFGVAVREWPTRTYAEEIKGSPRPPPLSGGSRIVDVEISDKFGQILKHDDANQPIQIESYRTLNKRGNNDLPEPEFVNATEESKHQLIPIMYSAFKIDKEGSGAMIDIIFENVSNHLFVFLKKGKLPIFDDYDLYRRIDSSGSLSLFLTDKEAKGTGPFYLGIGEYNSSITEAKANDPMGQKVTVDWLRTVSVNYKIGVLTVGCYYFNTDKKLWVSDGMTLLNASSTVSVCQTTHLTSFGAGLFVAPNTIDFSYVFANMGFNDNLTIYITLILTVSLFVLMLVWARYKDNHDVIERGAAPLPDNMPEDKYLYEVLVFTGNKRQAQTDSTVQFILTGENGATDVRSLQDDQRKILRRAGCDIFVMAVPRPLGTLSHLNIWHDNSGKGPNASWFLGYIVFRDVQTGEKFEFIANKWFALEVGNGVIEHVIPVANAEQKKQFGHLFHHTSNRNLSNDHLWFSVFMRPARSRFTRTQRVACCFSILFLSMLVNAMWYNTVPSQPTVGSFSFGPFSLSPEQIGVGVMSNLLIFPPSFLIIFFFKKARPRVLRKSRVEDALKRASEKSKEKNENFLYGRLTDDSETLLEPVRRNSKKYIKDVKKKFTLPWYFKYIAWFLVVVCVLVSVTFMLFYGVMFGNEKATKWVTSLVVSLFSSILLVQPIKIFLLSLALSWILKKPDLDEDDADEDELEPNLNDDQLWLYDGVKSNRLGYSKLNKSVLEQLRIKRLKEIEMGKMLTEIFVYMIYLMILLVLSYAQRDPNSYYLQNSLKNSFVHPGALDRTDFDKVSNTDLLWYYIRYGFMGDLRADVMYNGRPPYHLRGFLNDYANRIMGYCTIRQIRVKENSCLIPGPMGNVTSHCAAFSNLIHEERQHFCKGWKKRTEKNMHTSDCNVPEFKYETAEKLQSMPFWGKQDWYGGGGYVIHLRGPTKDLLKKFQYLQENHWINKMTRAVLIEFSTYNAQVNLFGICTMIAEITPGGGIRPHYNFDAISLLPHQDGFGAFMMACEIGFILFLIYYTVKELTLLYRQRWRYFDSYWSYAELSLILVSYIAIILYVFRYIETNKSMKVFHKTYGNGYVKMTYAASLNEMYGYAVAFLVFVGTIKIAKILRFNKEIGFLSATLHSCWDDLSGFLLAFAICFFSFVIMFYFLLSPHIEGFAAFISALETSFSMMMGKFQFNEMKEINSLIPIMFFVFVLCTSWILINLLVTIVIKAFEEVRTNILKQPNEFEMVEFMLGQMREFVGLNAVMSQPVRPEQKATPQPYDRYDETKEQQKHHDDVVKLPEKVDKFLDYLNKVYFDGELDAQNKGLFTDSFELGARPIISTDNDTGFNYKLFRSSMKREESIREAKESVSTKSDGVIKVKKESVSTKRDEKIKETKVSVIAKKK